MAALAPDEQKTAGSRITRVPNGRTPLNQLLAGIISQGSMSEMDDQCSLQGSLVGITRELERRVFLLPDPQVRECF
jgi:hypothetical protein